MKIKALLFLILLSGSLQLQSQSSVQEDVREFEMQEGDTTYTMKRYVMVLLKRGDQAETFTEQELEELQAAHLANINRLAAEGIIAVAGPFGDDGDLRGIFIMDLATVEEAERHVGTDPMIQAGRLKAEYHPWWGAKGTCLP